jgi:hypothetical protein
MRVLLLFVILVATCFVSAKKERFTEVRAIECDVIIAGTGHFMNLFLNLLFFFNRRNYQCLSRSESIQDFHFKFAFFQQPQ